MNNMARPYDEEPNIEIDADELFECPSCGMAYANEEQALQCCHVEAE